MDQKIYFGWFVVAAAFVILLLGFGIAYSFASFFDGFEADFQASRGDISLVFSIAGQSRRQHVQQVRQEQGVQNKKRARTQMGQ